MRDLTAHLERYGDEVVEHWSFEVWNEANLEVFWSGSPSDYLKLYDVTAAAIRDVDERLRVGGPSSAAGWVEELLAHADRSGAPVDFVSTHTYGAPPLDFRPMLERYGRAGTPIWWTEWGVTPTHFNEVSDAVFSGAFLLRGCSSMGRIESLSYWVVSDHFEEPRAAVGAAARGVRPAHGGRAAQAALVGAGDARAARLHPAGRVAGRRRCGLARRGGRGHVRLGRRVGAAVEPDARPDQGRRIRGSAREVSVEVRGLVPDATYTLRHERVDEDHSNVASASGRLRETAATADRRAVGGASRGRPARDAGAGPHADGGRVGRGAVDTVLPMPSISQADLVPGESP